ncbi:uncharacterized protein LOC133183721 [Saccostrea echinata]|uniref:uncharacterized protein LOC133183721 n=1 Tax=Saccostrea echinata TaxID=191078 RepID=UPI002A7FB836|nr:uncharacterized protein LOC133183721 [Saccostrea echinata]
MAETRNSNATMDTALESLVAGVLSTSLRTTQEDEIPLHRTKKNVNVSIPPEHLFCELTSLIPVHLDSEDEDSSYSTDQVVSSFPISPGEKDSLLSDSKDMVHQEKTSKLGRLMRNIFSKKKNTGTEKKIDWSINEKELAVRVFPSQELLVFDDFTCKDENSAEKEPLFHCKDHQKKPRAKRPTRILLSCFRKQ